MLATELVAVTPVPKSTTIPNPKTRPGIFGYNRTARQWGRCGIWCGLGDHWVGERGSHQSKTGDHSCLAGYPHEGDCVFPSTCRRSD